MKRDQIAAAVRSVHLLGMAGTCSIRTVLGYMALSYLGMQPRLVIGGVIFRAGPDPIMDIVAFCGSSNHAQLPNLFHAWLEVDNHVIDFSTGDWVDQMPETLEAVPINYPGELRPIQWDHKPPAYLWRPVHEVINAIERSGTPEPGVISYARGFQCASQADMQRAAEFQAGMVAECKPTCHLVWPTVKAALQTLEENTA